jgi:predicted nucleic acid-binding protein
VADIVFLDANVLFSAEYRPDSGLRRLWHLRAVRLVSSHYAVEEARRNLADPPQRDALEALLTSVTLSAEAAPVDPGLSASTPPSLPEKDRPIFKAAVAAGATHLLTGDLRHFGSLFGERVEGVLVLPPGEYLRGRAATDGSEGPSL